MTTERECRADELQAGDVLVADGRYSRVNSARLVAGKVSILCVRQGRRTEERLRLPAAAVVTVTGSMPAAERRQAHAQRPDTQPVRMTEGVLEDMRSRELHQRGEQEHNPYEQFDSCGWTAGTYWLTDGERAELQDECDFYGDPTQPLDIAPALRRAYAETARRLT